MAAADLNVVDMGLPLSGEGEHHGPMPSRVYEGTYNNASHNEFVERTYERLFEDESRRMENESRTNGTNVNGTSIDGIYVQTVRLKYEHLDTMGSRAEIDEWFEYEDIDLIQSGWHEYQKKFRAHQTPKSTEQAKSTAKTKETDRAIKQLLKEISIDMKTLEGQDMHLCDDCNDLEKRSQRHTTLAHLLSLLLSLSYIAQGAFCRSRGQTVPGQIMAMMENCRQIWLCGGLPIIWKCVCYVIDAKYPEDVLSISALRLSEVGNLSTAASIGDQLDEMFIVSTTILYLMLEMLRGDEQFETDLDKLDPPVIVYLIECIGQMRWAASIDIQDFSKMCQLLWKVMLCLFGDSNRLRQVKKHQRRRYKLDDEPEREKEKDRAKGKEKDRRLNLNGKYDHRKEDHRALEQTFISASPLDYHAFREDIVSRYASYNPPASKVPAELETDSSIGHYVQMARPQHRHLANWQLPAPQVHIATPAPSPPPSPVMGPGQKANKSAFMTNPSFPFLYPSQNEVPFSIVEAGELFASVVHTTPAQIQIWEERYKFMQSERGFKENTHRQDDTNEDYGQWDCAEQTVLDRVKQTYEDCLETLPSFVQVLVSNLGECINGWANELDGMKANYEISRPNGMAGNGSARESDEELMCRTRPSEICAKAVSAVIQCMMWWFKASHILKFEYLACLLYDQNIHVVVYKFLQSQAVMEQAMCMSSSGSNSWGFFSICKTLRENHHQAAFSAKASGFQDFCQEYRRAAKPNTDQNRTDGVDLDNCSNSKVPDSELPTRIDEEPFSTRYVFTLINMLDILRRTIKGKTFRIIAVAEMPSQILKRALAIYQPDLWRIVLEIFKEQVRFNGKSWRHHNMGLVSAIYLHCRAKLREDWLVGVDAQERQDASSQELAMRAIVEFFNKRY